jgi:hypothetical protein
LSINLASAIDLYKGVSSAMDQVVAQFKSPVFWVCTILASLILNVLSHYITRSVDRGIGFLGKLGKDLFDPRGNRRAARVRKYTEWLDRTENGAVLLLQRSVSIKNSATISAFVVLFFLVTGNTIQNSVFPAFIYLWTIDVVAFTVITLVQLNRARKLEAIVNDHRKGFADLPGIKRRN